ncbi:MAG: hypothetical protein ACT4OZ_09910 [Gemmatimonadota bacterium]
MKTFIRATPAGLGALVALALIAPGTGAQRTRERGHVGTGSVSDIMNARRLLDLTPRQLAQLDSIERSGFQARSLLNTRLQARRDSLCATRNPCTLSREERAAFLDWADSQRPTRAQMLRSDSLTRHRVMAVLDSTQRARLSGLRARRSSGFDGPRAVRRGPGGPPAFRGQRPGDAFRGRPVPGFRDRDGRMRERLRSFDRPRFGGPGTRGRVAPPGPRGRPEVIPRQRRRPEA